VFFNFLYTKFKGDMKNIVAHNFDTALLLPSLPLASTQGGFIDLRKQQGIVVVFVFPRISSGLQDSIENWSEIAGAKGCSEQALAFADMHKILEDAGVQKIYGLSCQTPALQSEIVNRLALPYPLLSDIDLIFSQLIGLPVFEVAQYTLNNRITLLIDQGEIFDIIYPVPTPSLNPTQVLLKIDKYLGVNQQ